MEKVKSFAILILAVSLISSYFMIYNLLDTNSKLQNKMYDFESTIQEQQNKVYDLESVIRVHEIINRTGKNGG